MLFICLPPTSWSVSQFLCIFLKSEKKIRKGTFKQQSCLLVTMIKLYFMKKVLVHMAVWKCVQYRTNIYIHFVPSHVQHCVSVSFAYRLWKLTKVLWPGKNHYVSTLLHFLDTHRRITVLSYKIPKICENLVIPGMCALFSAPYLLAIGSHCFIKRKSFSIKIIVIVGI